MSVICKERVIKKRKKYLTSFVKNMNCCGLIIEPTTYNHVLFLSSRVVLSHVLSYDALQLTSMEVFNCAK